MLQRIDLPGSLQLNREALIKAAGVFSVVFPTVIFDSFLGNRTLTEAGSLKEWFWRSTPYLASIHFLG
jgi:hypothetical protein